MKKTLTFLLGLAAYFVVFTSAHAQLLIQDDSTYNTAAEMLLANELFESGEPFAEALGYDLDELDPMVPYAPDSMSYTMGIESYEYSRYLLNTLTGRSAMGLHMMWSPVIMANAAMQPDTFDGMFTGGVQNGYKEDDMLMMTIGNISMNANQPPPANAWPQFADFAFGNNNLPQPVEADFASNFGSTRWDRTKMDKTLNLAAMGQSMWKQYWWSQDMLSAFHDGDDNGIEADGTNSPDFEDSPFFDPDNNIYYGGNNLDGYIGQVLTAVAINKTKFIISSLAYDGTGLGGVDPATYDPSAGIKYFPTAIAVTESPVISGLPPQASDLTVVDATSQLFDQISFMLATLGYRNMMNPNDNSDAAHLAYHEAFDGYPFPADMAATGVPGPFNLMMGASKVTFLNMMVMHFDSDAGTFVDEASLDGSGVPVKGDVITAENAGYALVVLRDFLNEFAGTPLYDMANNGLMAQANFILSNFADANGGFYNSYTVGSGADASAKTLAANAALIRGLYAAYEATGNTDYLDAANNGYNFLINNFYVPGEHVFHTTMNDNTAVYTPWNLAILAGALREAKLVGEQSGPDQIYTRVFKVVYDQMILSEAQPTGEEGSDSDGDGVPYIVGGTKPFVFAASGVYEIPPVSTRFVEAAKWNIRAYPNPVSEELYIDLTLDQAAEVQITLYELSGKSLLSTEQTLSAGKQTFAFSLGKLSAGDYVARISVEGEPIGIRKISVMH